MTGQKTGIANGMTKFVNEKYHLNKRIGFDVHCPWCLDHRLNLVAQDFRDVPNNNFVIRLVKWITAGDR